ncbi:CobW family GTP-binding protein [Bacillus sp. SD088]|uniref:CobW family GTP-binding protein n=1 Tax=Bacillus sp. SD088 TaxID=2782012 RepID=UPI001A95DFB7|nr:GTP-binding protein [Bacillus sp. SD088]MBO0991543.1 GTP-binding protein [Bacillus sp. SD088]
MKLKTSMKTDKRIPVYVLGGFLGSGKTTVLLHMLQYCEQMGWKPGVILNELGEANVEGHLFHNKKVYELLNGCICCTIQDDLKETMDTLISEITQQPLDILFIEGTGVANPLEIQEVMSSTPYIDQFQLMSIITVIDASHFLEYQSIFSSSAEVRHLLEEQIVCGSLLLLNKTDVVSIEQLKKLKQKVMKIAGDKKVIVESAYGEVDPALLFEQRIQSIVFDNKATHNAHHHHSSVKAIKLDELPAFNQRKFEKWIKQLPDGVLRGKGFIKLEGSDDLFSFQYAAKKVAFAPISASLEREAVINLIGIGIEEKQIQQSYKKLITQ